MTRPAPKPCSSFLGRRYNLFMPNQSQRLKKRVSANEIFNKYLAKSLTGRNSGETIVIFSRLNYNSFYDLAKKYRLKERQISSLIGLKDEFFVATLVNQIIQELKLANKFSCAKVTANEKSGLKSRVVKCDRGDKVLMVGGDCVIFGSADNKPLMIIECKEYVDMIRLKELIGESRIIKDTVSNSVNLLGDVKFCVFAEVLELTHGWSYLLGNSDLKHKIDEIFVIRDGKRKDKANMPVKENLVKFKRYIENFLARFKQNSQLF